MSIITLSALGKELLGTFYPSPEEKALVFMMVGIKEYLKECNLEILEYETKYGFSIDELRKQIETGEIKDEFSYPLEIDIIKWEDLISEKKILINLITKIGNLHK